MSITRRNTPLILIAQFLSALYFTIPIWIPYYQGRISVEQISFIVGFQYAIQMFLELPTGALADLIGRKFTVLLGYLTMAISSVIVIFHPDFTIIFIATIFAGMSEALISGSLEALLYDSYKQEGKEDQFPKAMAKNGFWYQIALAIGTLSGGFLYPIWYGLPFLLQGVSQGIAVLVSFFLIEPKIDSEHFTLKNYVRQVRDGMREAFKSRAVAVMSLFYIFVGGITWTNQLYFNSFMLVELGFTDQQRSVIGGVLRILNVFILTGLLSNEKLFTRERTVFFFPIMMVLCYLPGMFYQGWWALPLVAGALMAGTARWIVLSKYTNQMIESRYRATAISALSMIIGVIYIAITTASGPVIEHFGGVRMMYTLMGTATLFTVVPLAFVVVRNKPPQ